MREVLSDGLLLPALLLAIAAFVVPRFMARMLPEGVTPLMVNAFLSTLILIAVSGILFWCLYLWQGLQAEQLADQGLAANLVFFGRLALLSGLIWAPIMILSVAGLPRKWVHATW
ncbi:MAG: hypothetical protein ACJAZ1_003681 [Yoonia sp.]|jgi:hypothetical protein